MKDEAVSPHIWKAVHPAHSEQWACVSKRRTPAWAMATCRVYYPVGCIYYGSTPLEAYNKWRTDNVGRA